MITAEDKQNMLFLDDILMEEIKKQRRILQARKNLLIDPAEDKDKIDRINQYINAQRFLMQMFAEYAGSHGGLPPK